MSRTVRALINEGEGRFTAFAPGDRLVAGPLLELACDTDAEALDAAWVAGNRMDPATPWPRDVRSLSVADILVVRGGKDGDRVYAVERIGFAALEPGVLVGALAFGEPKH